MPHLKPIILTAIHTGMRKNEMLSLKWATVDLEHNIIIVEATNTKSKKLKRVPINSKLRKVLIEQKLKRVLMNMRFLNPEGKPYQRRDSLKRYIERACRRAGIKRPRFHDLRHSAATRMVEKGANIVAVKRMLGHADINTTMRYVHPDDSLKDAAEKLANHTANYSQNCSQEESDLL